VVSASGALLTLLVERVVRELVVLDVRVLVVLAELVEPPSMPSVQLHGKGWHADASCASG
jgi:hypothetical protein